MNISEKLQNIQKELKAPKNLYNSFGKYNYRNAEGICEAVKPLLAKYGAALTLSDDIRQVGDRYYIEATALFFDSEDAIKVKALARESLEKKGMDDSQITGTASSYARKYALNGLFLLDDTKDADTEEYHEVTKAPEKKPVQKYITPEQKVELLKEMNRTGMTTDALFKWAKIDSVDNLRTDQFNKTMAQLKTFPNKE